MTFVMITLIIAAWISTLQPQEYNGYVNDSNCWTIMVVQKTDFVNLLEKFACTTNTGSTSTTTTCSRMELNDEWTKCLKSWTYKYESPLYQAKIKEKAQESFQNPYSMEQMTNFIQNGVLDDSDMTILENWRKEWIREFEVYAMIMARKWIKPKKLCNIEYSLDDINKFKRGNIPNSEDMRIIDEMTIEWFSKDDAIKEVMCHEWIVKFEPQNTMESILSR